MKKCISLINQMINKSDHDRWLKQYFLFGTLKAMYVRRFINYIYKFKIKETL